MGDYYNQVDKKLLIHFSEIGLSKGSVWKKQDYLVFKESLTNTEQVFLDSSINKLVELECLEILDKASNGFPKYKLTSLGEVVVYGNYQALEIYKKDIELSLALCQETVAHIIETNNKPQDVIMAIYARTHSSFDKYLVHGAIRTLIAESLGVVK